MNPDERIDRWARSRADASVPDGFADRVVAAATRRRRGVPAAAQAAALLAAGALAALRIAAALAVFLPR
jgi:hypothetical protein